MHAKNLMQALVVAALASSTQSVFAQMVREPCAKALNLAAYAQNPADKRKQLEAFASNKCVADIMNVYGAAGVPKPGDGAALAMAAIAYKSLLDQTAERKPAIGSAGGITGGAVAATAMSVDEIIKRMNAGDGGVATGAGNPAAKPAVGPSK